MTPIGMAVRKQIKCYLKALLGRISRHCIAFEIQFPK